MHALKFRPHCQGMATRRPSNGRTTVTKCFGISGRRETRTTDPVSRAYGRQTDLLCHHTRHAFTACSLGILDLVSLILVKRTHICPSVFPTSHALGIFDLQAASRWRAIIVPVGREGPAVVFKCLSSFSANQSLSSSGNQSDIYFAACHIGKRHDLFSTGISRGREVAAAG